MLSLCADIHVPQMMNVNGFGGPLTASSTSIYGFQRDVSTPSRIGCHVMKFGLDIHVP